MQLKINAIFTKRVLEFNGSLRFNDSLSSCNRAQNVKVNLHLLCNVLIATTVSVWSCVRIPLYTEPKFPAKMSGIQTSIHVFQYSGFYLENLYQYLTVFFFWFKQYLFHQIFQHLYNFHRKNTGSDGKQCLYLSHLLNYFFFATHLVF